MAKGTPAVKATKTIKPHPSGAGKTAQKHVGPGKSMAAKVHAGTKGPIATIKY